MDCSKAGTAPRPGSVLAAPRPGLVAEPVSDKCFEGGVKAPEALLTPSLPCWLQGRALLSPITLTSMRADPAGCLIPKGIPAFPTLLD